MAIVDHTQSERFLSFVLSREHFAIPIASVREILDLQEITRIPQMPGAMRGIVNVRGAAVPVIDLRRRFGFGESEATVNTRIIIMEIPTPQGIMLFGAIADSVKEVLELDAAAIDPPPSMGSIVSTALLRGIGKHGGSFILLLDVEKMLHVDDLTLLNAASRPQAVLRAEPSETAALSGGAA